MSYDPENHEKMVAERAAKIDKITEGISALEIIGPKRGKLLVLSWGSTHGSILTAIETLQNPEVAMLVLRHLHPFPKDLGNILKNYESVLIPELNSGQLCHLIRAKYLVDAIPHNKVSGKPFLVSEISNQIEKLL